MARSQSTKPLGLNPLEMALLTAGPLGHNDFASQDDHGSSPGDTPGPVGVNDLSASLSDNTSKRDECKLQQRVVAVITPTSGAAGRLSENDFAVAANALGPDVSVAIIKAFAEVESGGKSGFGPDGLPIIAYEGHIFRRLTRKRHDPCHPLLSYCYSTKAGQQWRHNNRSHSASWRTLRAAMELDFTEALQSCSWGMFQVMGFNFKSCGFKTVEEFVDAMKSGHRGQLMAFVAFCRSRRDLPRAIAENDYQTMALLYNGEDYGNYDKLIERSFQKHAKH